MLRRIVRGDKKVQIQDIIKQVDAFPKVGYEIAVSDVSWGLR
jgi:hypothetical protein